jgi:hypothetical protein
MIRMSKFQNLAILGSQLAMEDFTRGGHKNTYFKRTTEAIKELKTTMWIITRIV